MAGLTIGWEYLTGYYRATNPASREKTEWPPHPGRVFMALAAAWFETGEDAAEGNALRWLEKLGDPEMMLPPGNDGFERRVVTFNVPINGDQFNDMLPHFEKNGETRFHTRPTDFPLKRLHVEQTYPCRWVGDDPCFLHWPSATATDVDAHQSALDQLCGKVTRIGHSSSLVRMWLAEEARSLRQSETWLPDDGLADLQVRRVSEGTLDLLDRQFNGRARNRIAQLDTEIKVIEDRITAAKQRSIQIKTDLVTQKKTIKGTGSAQRKQELAEQFASQQKLLNEQVMELESNRARCELEANGLDPRPPIRPKLGLWSGYRRQESEPTTPAQRTDFDSDLLILTQVDGPRLPSVSMLAVSQALRGAVMKHGGLQPPPPWVSGHVEAGQPLRDGNQHLALLPLPFVGGDYADGHLLGVALAFPRWVSRQERGRILGPMLLERSGESKSVELQLGALGVWTIVKRDWSEPRKALKPETWSAHPEGSRIWASVTPVVLDGFPKEDRLRDRSAWNSEVLAMLARACQRVGLPEPASVDFDTTSWHQGSPRALLKRRPLRGHPEVGEATAGLGDGFPPYPAKGTSGIRPQFHVWLRFADPVVGPVIVGAGRFLGYGLCKPLWGVPS